MKKKIEIKTIEGSITIHAEEVLPGLFLHKMLVGNGKFTSNNHYSLTEKKGRGIYRQIKAPKRKIIPWAKENLKEFDWENVDDFSQEEQKKIINLTTMRECECPFMILL